MHLLNNIFCVFLIKNLYEVEENSDFAPLIFFNLCFRLESVKRNSIIMISKGCRYVIHLGIISNVYIIVYPVFPGSCARESSVVGELRGISVLSSP